MGFRYLVLFAATINLCFDVQGFNTLSVQSKLCFYPNFRHHTVALAPPYGPNGHKCRGRSSRSDALKCVLSSFQEEPNRRSTPSASRGAFFRFPQKLEEAIGQASDCTLCALDEGHHRVRVQFNIPEFDVRAKSLQSSSVMNLVNMLGSNLVSRGLRVNLIFNSIADVADARRLLRKDIEESVKLNVLGLGSFGQDQDIAVLVCPCNEGNENLRRIEAVERLLYSRPPPTLGSNRKSREAQMHRPIIMINPRLEAIHPHSNHHRKVVPMFMSDFETAYYLDPHVIRFHESMKEKSHAGLLKAYPSPNWQLWIRPRGGREGFKLVWQRPERPSASDLSSYLGVDSGEDDSSGGGGGGGGGGASSPRFRA